MRKKQKGRNIILEQNNGIMGMDALLEKLPREYQNWFCFGHILKFEYKEIFDYENWDTRYNAELILSNDSETYKIRLLLKHISGEFTIRVTEDIVGLNIRNLTGSGLESCNHFHIYDFENDAVSIYCEEIEAELLEHS
jgi:hypothetical protein